MKQLATIGVVVLVLVAAALYLGTKNQPTPTPNPPTPPIASPTPTPTPPVNADGNPNSVGSQAGTLTLKGALSNGYVLANQTHEVFSAIDIAATKFEGGKRPPLNVALVIDRSGSMSGDKIEHAKEAARRFINMLDSADRLAIVSYGSDVTVDSGSKVVTDANRMELLRAVSRISVGGGTNLSGGWEQGFNEISRWKSANSVNRVVLMSDGHANIGTTNSSRLVAKSSEMLRGGVSVTSMGVGLDYNEDLMTRIANEGGGNYYFVDDSAQIVSMFEKELKGLASTVARNAVVVLELGQGVEIKDLFGFPHRQQGSKAFISLAEFYSEQSKNILLKLNVPFGSEKTKPILNVQLSYEDMIKGAPAHQVVRLSSATTTDAAKVEKSTDVSVISRVHQVEVATSMQQAMQLYEKGQTAEAQKVLRTTQSSTRQRRAKFNYGGKKYDAADKEMDTLTKDLQMAAPSSSQGKRMIKRKKARSNAIYLNEAAF